MVLTSDLDNTLIYSYKRDIGKEKVGVEVYEGRMVSFMTKQAYEWLNDLYDKIWFIPVSTRSIAQYRRIRFHENWIPKIALVSNGGTLLRDGVEDEVWKKETQEMIACAWPELERARAILEEDPYRILEVRVVDDCFVFTKSELPNLTIRMLSAQLNSKIVDIHQNGPKVYVLPKLLNKGIAIRRLKKFFDEEIIIAAGDSEFDVPMLKEADIAFYPEAMDGGKEHSLKGHVVHDGVILSDVLLGTIQEWTAKSMY